MVKKKLNYLMQLEIKLIFEIVSGTYIYKMMIDDVIIIIMLNSFVYIYIIRARIII